ncbi:hypothetical protein GBAR_LOCUS21683, partial [Geodia barretti]
SKFQPVFQPWREKECECVCVCVWEETVGGDNLVIKGFENGVSNAKNNFFESE